MWTKKFFHFFLTLLVLFALETVSAHAQLTFIKPAPTGISTNQDISQTVLLVSQWIINILGGVAILALIYGGARYIIAAGNEKEVEKAKEVIKYSVIGLVLVILSFTIASTINNIFLTRDNTNARACYCQSHPDPSDPTSQICTTTPISGTPSGCDNTLACDSSQCQ